MVRIMVSDGMDSAFDQFAIDVDEFAEAETDFNTHLLGSSVPAGLINAPPLHLVKQSVANTPFDGHLLKNWFTSLNSASQRTLLGQLNMGLV